jgi:hypothetical protein
MRNRLIFRKTFNADATALSGWCMIPKLVNRWGTPPGQRWLLGVGHTPYNEMLPCDLTIGGSTVEQINEADCFDIQLFVMPLRCTRSMSGGDQVR